MTEIRDYAWQSGYQTQAIRGALAHLLADRPDEARRELMRVLLEIETQNADRRTAILNQTDCEGNSEQ